MFYDLNLSHNFTDFKYLKDLNCLGVCHTYDFTDINQAFIPPRLINSSHIPIYTRCNIEFTSKLDTTIINKLSKIYNVVCIRTNSFNNIPTISKLAPDLVEISLEQLKHIKKNFSGLLKDSNLFIEISIRDAIYTKRILWMSVLRKLLKYNCKKNIIISSAAKVFTELKSYNDIQRILRLFIKNENIIREIIQNSAILLEKAANKRFLTNGVIANSNDEGRFKKDFILKKFNL